MGRSFRERRKKIKKHFSILILSVFLLSTNFIFTNPIAFAADAVLGVTKITDYDFREPGKTITFDIQYQNSSLTEDALNARLVDTIPTGMEYIGFDLNGSTHVESVDEPTGAPQTVTFNFVNPLPAGTTGVLKVMARFKNGETLNDTVLTNNVELDADNAPAVTSSVDVRAVTKAPDWHITKSKTSPVADPVSGQPVTYRLTLHANSSGGLNMHDVRIEDTLPPNISDVVVADGGVYDSGTGKVTWTIGDLNVGSTINRDITFTYSAAHYTISSSATNTATAYGKLYGDTTEISVSGSATHGFKDPIYTIGGFDKTNRQGAEEYSIGQTAVYDIGGFHNTGNVPLEDFYVEDAIPNELNLTSITTGRTSSEQTVTISYQSNGTSGWQHWGDYSTASSQTLNVSALGLGGDYVTNVRWYYGTVPIDFDDTTKIRLNATILSNNRVTSAPVVDVTNTAHIYWEYAGDERTQSDNSYFTINSEFPWFEPVKTVQDKIVNYKAGFEVPAVYTLRLKNHAFATGTLNNPIGIDVLPIYINAGDGTYSEILENLSWEWDVGNSGLTKASITDPIYNVATINIDGRNRTVLKWEFNDPAVILDPGEYVEITLTGDVRDLVHTGLYTNTFYQTTNSTDTIKDRPALVDDTNDLDQDGRVDDRLYPVSEDVFVKFNGALESDKWVRGELDSAWMQYPDPGFGVGKTLPGGIADYQLRVRNPGSNGPIENLVIIDLLPRIGDIGLIDTSARQTVWEPYLINKITGENGTALPPDVTVYYSTNPSPSLTELEFGKYDNGSAGDGWSSTPPSDITTVKSVKIDFGSTTFNPGDEVIVEWPMRAPVGAPVNEIAWNSFAFTATYPGFKNGAEADINFLAAEPKKVGFEVLAYPGTTVHIGDYVWHDVNANGVQDVGESGINGVRVNLYHGSDTPGVSTPVGYTMTGDHHNGNAGYYEFPDIPTGSYKVEFIYPERYYLSPQNVGDESTDSDGLASTKSTSGGKTSVHTGSLNITSDNMNIDLGLYLATQLGDTIWYDIDSDGIQDSGENGVANVEVRLTDMAGNPVDDVDGVQVANITTGADGKYLFTNLKPDDYKVVFSNIPTGYVFTQKDAGSDDSKDSDADPTGETTVVSPPSDGSNLTADAGIHAASLGNYVWLDWNRNGVFDTGEAPVQNAKVNLLDSTSTQIKTTNTDSSGWYMFRDLLPGDYYVEFELTTGFQFTTQNTGGDDNVDSDVNTATNRTELINLSPGEVDDTVDAGICYKPSSLGDTVWYDADFDGVQDAGESGIEGVTVNLRDGSDNLIATTTTLADGSYLFDTLNPMNYKVEFVAPAGHTFSERDQGSDDNLDSDVPVSGITDAITLAADENNLSIDAGLYVQASLGDYVWVDKNRDGLQDSGEPGISGIQVELLDGGGVVLATTFTNDTGYYLFSSLVPGTYSVRFTLPASILFTEKDQGSSDLLDSDADKTTGESAQVTLLKGEHNTSLDAGVIPLFSIGDRVWIDDDTDGIQDSSELKLNGVEITLFDANTGLEVEKQTTRDDAFGEAGYYLFENVPVGNYYLRMALPANYAVTRVNQGGNDSVDSDGYMDGELARTQFIDLTANTLLFDLGLVDLIKYPNWNVPYSPVENPKTGDYR